MDTTRHSALCRREGAIGYYERQAEFGGADGRDQGMLVAMLPGEVDEIKEGGTQ